MPDEFKNVSQLNIEELHDLSLRYGFLILKPSFIGEHKDLKIEVPTAIQRGFIDNEEIK